MLPRLTTTASRDELLGVYLTDHDAAAAAAISLANRAADHVRHQATKEQIGRIATELAEDREVLRQVMSRLDVRPAAWKVMAAMAAERVGRLKLNGQVLRPSPLGNVWELEALLDAVAAKRRLWQAIAEVPGLEAAADIDSRHMIERLQAQLDRLHPLWLVAISTAFPATPPGPDVPTTEDGQATR